MSEGIRARGKRIQVRYTVRGVRHERTLDLVPTEENLELAAKLRATLIQQTRIGIAPVITGVGLQELEDAVNVAFAAARKRGGEAYGLSRDEEQKIVTRARGCCELTGIPFSMHKEPGWYRAPFAPSVDRIESARGYTCKNTRLVCVAVNLAMNQWGEGVLAMIADGYKSRQIVTSAPTSLGPSVWDDDPRIFVTN